MADSIFETYRFVVYYNGGINKVFKTKHEAEKYIAEQKLIWTKSEWELRGG